MGASSARARAFVAPVLAAALVLLCPACGGGSSTATTAPQRPQATADELRWAAEVDAFVAGLLPDLRRLEQLTGGGPKVGAVGGRLDPRIFVPGAKRRQFEATMTALSSCRLQFAAAVRRPPTDRLLPLRATFAHACDELEQVSALLRTDVLRARSQADVDRAVLDEASGRADEGVRSIATGLSTMRRLLP